MIRIMFVCHGNICRSPMAEFIMKDICEKNGAADKFVIASSATSTEEIWNGIGNPVYPPAQSELAKHNIKCGGKRAVQLKKSDYDKYDLFVVMDNANLRNANRIFGTVEDKKVVRLMDYTPQGEEVSDPWYSGRFDVAYDDILKGCTALFDILVSEGRI